MNVVRYNQGSFIYLYNSDQSKNFIKNNYLGTYDKNFKKISERHI